MKNLITITLLFISAIISAQVSPVFGVKYTGGLSYNLDHEYPSIEAGIYKNLSVTTYFHLDKLFNKKKRWAEY